MTGESNPNIGPEPDKETNSELSLPAQPGRLKRLVNRVRQVFTLAQKSDPWLMLIVNPASGQGSPDLRLLNRLVKAAGMRWEMVITNAFGDGERLARDAVRRGACVVAAYGGDGTIMDIAAGLRGSSVPLGIIPGGTGNALAKELLIPLDMKSAIELILAETPVIRRIDLGMANERLFLLRFGAGLEADITRTADREMKDRLGVLAYPTATIQAWSQASLSMYRLELDGEVVEIEGLACMVANAATLGIPGLNISPDVRIDDGLLDVFVLRRADMNELASLAASMLGSPQVGANQLPHWQCRELLLSATPEQQVEADGEELGQTPVRVRVVPGAFAVITPLAARPAAAGTVD
jgi:diacylglycerol kinase (ATP)